MLVCGRIKNIKKTKRNVFLQVSGEFLFQIVIKYEIYNDVICEQIYNNDIISATVHLDDMNNGRFKSLLPSYIAEKISVLSHSKSNSLGLELYMHNVVLYSEAKKRVRSLLESKNYIEVVIPILTDGETSSKADSFETYYKKTSKKLYLRKTMDSFLRMYSCCDYNRVYAIGPCFRNEFITSINVSEFEMLSIFSNYLSLDEAKDLAIEIIYAILGKQLSIKKITQCDYEKLKSKNGAYLIENIKNTDNSYCEMGENDYTQEFKLKLDEITLVHGVQEISTLESYNNRIKLQGKKENYGELKKLEWALSYGAPPCVNLGISIIRTLAVYNKMKIKEFDPLSLHRLNMGHQIG